MDPHIQHTELPSGTDVYWLHDPSVKYVRLGCIVWTGSFEDPEELFGMAHLLEHVMFEGSADYPSSIETDRVLDDLAGMWNGKTSSVATQYEVAVPMEELTYGLRLLLDTVLHPRLDRPGFLRALDVVKREYAEGEQPAEHQEHQREAELMFGLPLGKRILGIGSPTSLDRISLSNLRAFYQREYRAQNMTFVMVGNFSRGDGRPDQVLLDALQPCGRNIPMQRRVYVPAGAQLPLARQFRSSRSHLLCLGVQAPLFDSGAHLSDDVHGRYAVPSQICQSILVGGLSSVLMRRLRVELQLVYDLQSTVHFLDHNLGFWTFSAPVESQDKLIELRHELQTILADDQCFSDARVEAAKTRIIRSIEMADHTPNDWFGEVMGSLESGRRVTTTIEFAEQVAHVTPEQVRNYFHRLHPDRWIATDVLPSEV